MATVRVVSYTFPTAENQRRFRSSVNTNRRVSLPTNRPLKLNRLVSHSSPLNNYHTQTSPLHIIHCLGRDGDLPKEETRSVDMNDVTVTKTDNWSLFKAGFVLGFYGKNGYMPLSKTVGFIFGKLPILVCICGSGLVAKKFLEEASKNYYGYLAEGNALNKKFCPVKTPTDDSTQKLIALISESFAVIKVSNESLNCAVIAAKEAAEAAAALARSVEILLRRRRF